MRRRLKGRCKGGFEGSAKEVGENIAILSASKIVASFPFFGDCEISLNVQKSTKGRDGSIKKEEVGRNQRRAEGRG